MRSATYEDEVCIDLRVPPLDHLVTVLLHNLCRLRPCFFPIPFRILASVPRLPCFELFLVFYVSFGLIHNCLTDATNPECAWGKHLNEGTVKNGCIRGIVRGSLNGVNRRGSAAAVCGLAGRAWIARLIHEMVACEIRCYASNEMLVLLSEGPQIEVGLQEVCARTCLCRGRWHAARIDDHGMSFTYLQRCSAYTSIAQDVHRGNSQMTMYTTYAPHAVSRDRMPLTSYDFSLLAHTSRV